jgi:hypothetical protein
MKHFSLAEWADFSRGIAGKGQREAMQAHLDSGCARCIEAAITWERVREIAKRERSYEPPRSAMQMAKSLLAVHGRPGKRPVLRMLFDSLQTPVVAGVRSTATVSRQMLYGFGTYQIDLRMEPVMDSDKVSLVGQVLSAADPVKMGAQVTVTLLRGRRVLAESRTNSLGEFHLECSLEGPLDLQLTLPRERDIKIPLLVPSETAIDALSDRARSELGSKLKRYKSTSKLD